MDSVYKINHDLDIPIYQQLVDSIRTAIKKGNLASGERLPTVREMTCNLGIARGTVKRVYDELERENLIEKVQGRGTFVSYQPINYGSKKEQSMAIIDAMLDRLEDMGLSASEINIFLNLKLRERSEREAQVKVAVVECNPENLSQMSEQLRHVAGVDLYSYMLESIKQYPYKLSEDFELIVTTSSHAKYLESVLPVKTRLALIALRPSARCLSHIIKLRPGDRVGVLGYSKRFCELLCDTCQTYADAITLCEPMLIASEMEIEQYLQDKDAVLVPKLYQRQLTGKVAEALRQFKGQLIECYYEMDEGSLLFLETKIKRLIENKTI